MITIFEDFTKELEDEEFLNTVKKKLFRSYKDIKGRNLKDKGKLKSKKKRLNTFPSNDGTFGQSPKDTNLLFRDDY